MNILITICARGGSKGIPMKNIVKVGGEHLISYSIEIAKKLFPGLNTKIVISTDNEKIKEVAQLHDIVSDYNRPEHLSRDETSKVKTIKHLVDFYEAKDKITYNYIIDLDVSSPIRTVSDIKKAFEMFKSNKTALNLFSVSASKKSPYYNIVEKKRNGYYGLVVSNKKKYTSRQEIPKTFDMNASFYLYRRIFFNLGLESPITNKSMIYEMDHICFDVDNFYDLEYLEYLVVNKKIKI